MNDPNLWLSRTCTYSFLATVVYTGISIGLNVIYDHSTILLVSNIILVLCLGVLMFYRVMWAEFDEKTNSLLKKDFIVHLFVLSIVWALFHVVLFSLIYTIDPNLWNLLLNTLSVQTKWLIALWFASYVSIVICFGFVLLWIVKLYGDYVQKATIIESLSPHQILPSQNTMDLVKKTMNPDLADTYLKESLADLPTLKNLWDVQVNGRDIVVSVEVENGKNMNNNK